MYGFGNGSRVIDKAKTVLTHAKKYPFAGWVQAEDIRSKYGLIEIDLVPVRAVLRSSVQPCNSG